MDIQQASWWAITVSATVGCATFVLSYCKAREEAKKDQNQKQLSLYVHLTQRVFEIDRIFIEHSEFRPYFYDCKILGKNDCVLKGDGFLKISALAEYILDFFSNLQELEPKLNAGSPSWKEWNDFIESGFATSPFLCAYFERNAKWYEQGLRDKYDPIGKRNHALIQRQHEAANDGLV
jgi:hypothetical protein